MPKIPNPTGLSRNRRVLLNWTLQLPQSAVLVRRDFELFPFYPFPSLPNQLDNSQIRNTIASRLLNSLYIYGGPFIVGSSWDNPGLDSADFVLPHARSFHSKTKFSVLLKFLRFPRRFRTLSLRKLVQAEIQRLGTILRHLRIGRVRTLCFASAIVSRQFGSTGDIPIFGDLGIEFWLRVQ